MGLIDSGLATIARLFTEQPPSDALRERILASATRHGRLDRFAEQVAGLTGMSRREAEQTLACLGDPGAWTSSSVPGAAFMTVRAGAGSEDTIQGVFRLPAGVVFPMHEHLGRERVLVLQGSCIDGGCIVRPGDMTDMPAGSRHSFEVRPGPDLVFLAVLQRGIRVLNAES